MQTPGASPLADCPGEEGGDAGQARGSSLWPLGNDLCFPKPLLWMALLGVTALI